MCHQCPVGFSLPLSRFTCWVSEPRTGPARAIGQVLPLSHLSGANPSLLLPSDDVSPSLFSKLLSVRAPGVSAALTRAQCFGWPLADPAATRLSHPLSSASELETRLLLHFLPLKHPRVGFAWPSSSCGLVVDWIGHLGVRGCNQYDLDGGSRACLPIGWISLTVPFNLDVLGA